MNYCADSDRIGDIWAEGKPFTHYPERLFLGSYFVNLALQLEGNVKATREKVNDAETRSIY